jgi:hypothetical protein
LLRKRSREVVGRRRRRSVDSRREAEVTGDLPRARRFACSQSATQLLRKRSREVVGRRRSPLRKRSFEFPDSRIRDAVVAGSWRNRRSAPGQALREKSDQEYRSSLTGFSAPKDQKPEVAIKLGSCAGEMLV